MNLPIVLLTVQLMLPGGGPQVVVQQALPDMATCLATRRILLLGHLDRHPKGAVVGDCIPLEPGAGYLPWPYGFEGNPYTQEF